MQRIIASQTVRIEHDAEILFIQPGKPTLNGYNESFNSRVLAEFLNAYWFRSLIEARAAAVEWRHAYHTAHAHIALNYMTPQNSSQPTNLFNFHRNHWPHDGSDPSVDLRVRCY